MLITCSQVVMMLVKECSTLHGFHDTHVNVLECGLNTEFQNLNILIMPCQIVAQIHQLNANIDLLNASIETTQISSKFIKILHNELLIIRAHIHCGRKQEFLCTYVEIIDHSLIRSHIQ